MKRILARATQNVVKFQNRTISDYNEYVTILHYRDRNRAMVDICRLCYSLLALQWWHSFKRMNDFCYRIIRVMVHTLNHFVFTRHALVCDAKREIKMGLKNISHALASPPICVYVVYVCVRAASSMKYNLDDNGLWVVSKLRATLLHCAAVI